MSNPGVTPLELATLWVVVVALGLTAAVAFTALWRQARGVPGLGSLALAHGLLAASGALIAGTGRIPSLLSLTGGDVLAVLAAALLVNGVRLLHGLPARRRLSLVLIVGVTAALSMIGVFAGGRLLSFAIAGPNAVLGALFVDASVTVLRRGRRHGEAVTGAIIAACFGLVGVGRLAVAGLALSGRAAGYGSATVGNDSLLAFLLLGSVVAGVGWAFGLFATINRQFIAANTRQAGYRASLSEVALTIMDRLELVPLLEAVVSRGVGLLEADRGFVYLESPDGTALQRRVWVGETPVDDLVAPDEGAVGRAWHRCQFVSVADYDSWEGRSPRVPRGAFGSMLAAPLRSGGRAVGAIGIARSRRGRRFNQEQAALLASFADLASVAVENARLYQEARSEIQSRKRAQEELARSEARFRELFEGSLALVCTHDLGGKLLSVNPAAAAALDHAPSDLVGRNLRELLPSAQRAELAVYLEAVQRDGQAEGVMTILSFAGKRRAWRYRNVLRRGGSEGPYVIGFAQDVTEELRAQAALRESEQRFRQVADNLDAVLFVRQVEPPAILYMSPAYRTIFGKDPAALVPQAASLFADVLPEDQPRLTAAYGAEQTQGGGFDETYRVMRPDGAIRWIHTRTFPGRRRADGRVERVIGLSQDITPLKQAEELRADLVRTLVHDLRTPLTGIVGCLDMLRSGRVQIPEVLPMAERSARRLQELVDSLLDIERLEHGALELRREEVALADLIAHARDSLAQPAEQKGVSLSQAVEGSLPRAWADPGLLLRVLTNLLGNAVKFTPPNGRVVVSAERTVAGMLCVRVRDSGPGIPDELAPRLFQRFVTGRSRGAGAGLGLMFCRLVVEAHGGRIDIEKAEPPGASFAFTVPAARAA